ncbi:cytochrome P450 [Goodfellowiella coeruleoviolacea]|uniref:Cytochrome P450 n=1 Tax=Goodfellowiella coeruleoviolacea TaxID=334858 RepID=A0AAE3GFU2_9PSEU|nr:cytochrome P450 [Goodfellowiella coeruleoviolacea]MCP2167456.1 Cytochrome P450 [Goodfellowiella coeruleoviolacea]
MRDPREVLAAAARSGNGRTELQPGLWLVTDPDTTEQLLAHRAAHTVRAAQRSAVTDWGADGLAAWLAARRAMRPALAPARVAGFTPVITSHAERITAGWQSPGSIDVLREAVRLVSTVNVHHLLGEPSPRLSALVERELTAAEQAGGVFPLRRRRLLRAQHATHTAIQRHVRADTARAGLLAVLADHGLSERVVTLALRNMLLSSHHVPAAALAWVFHELSTRPELQRRAHAEAAAHQDFRDLRLCRDIVRETLRLHPPVWQLQRQLAAPVVGFASGTTVLFSPYLNHRDPGAHAQPQRFHPDRWPANPHPAPGSYFPFALGPRFCPGSQLALVELTVILAAVLRTHRLAPHRSPTPARGVLHAPRGLRLRVSPRQRRDQG